MKSIHKRGSIVINFLSFHEKIINFCVTQIVDSSKALSSVMVDGQLVQSIFFSAR